MKRDDLEKLRIPREQRSSRGSHAILIFLAIAFILVAAAWFAWPRVSDSKRLVSQTQPQQTDCGSLRAPSARRLHQIKMAFC